MTTPAYGSSPTELDAISAPRLRRSVLRVVAGAGWTPEAAADLLSGERKSFRDVVEAVAASRRSAPPSEAAPFDDRCAAAVTRLYKVLRRLAEDRILTHVNEDELDLIRTVEAEERAGLRRLAEIGIR